MRQQFPLDVDQQLQEAMISITMALKKLQRIGLVVQKIHLEVGGRPTLTVDKNEHCERLAKEGKAVRYIYGCDKKGKFSWYQYQQHGCRVVWEDR